MLRDAVTVRLDAIQRCGSALGGACCLLFGEFALRLIETALLARQFLLEDALAIRVAGLLGVFLNLGKPAGVGLAAAPAGFLGAGIVASCVMTTGLQLLSTLVFEISMPPLASVHR